MISKIVMIKEAGSWQNKNDETLYTSEVKFENNVSGKLNTKTIGKYKSGDILEFDMKDTNHGKLVVNHKIADQSSGSKKFVNSSFEEKAIISSAINATELLKEDKNLNWTNEAEKILSWIMKKKKDLVESNRSYTEKKDESLNFDFNDVKDMPV